MSIIQQLEETVEIVRVKMWGDFDWSKKVTSEKDVPCNACLARPGHDCIQTTGMRNHVHQARLEAFDLVRNGQSWQLLTK